jgi:serine/threonine protein kinase
MLAEGQQLSHYRIVGLLKNGGMGEVYLAVDAHLNRQVAIKVINTDALRYAEVEAAKDAARLFLREARAIAQLDQTNILPLYDSGEQVIDGTSLMFMVMPYRHAGSLADWKRAYFGDHPLPLAAVERIVEQAALALQHAHDRQIIHQDVKPSNFLIQGNAGYPSELHLQLADFGVAKAMLMTSESQVIRGTPTYMAPEQWEGRPVPATDQYALAVMAYELLTGRTPFVGNGYQQMWHQHVHVTPEPLSRINPSLPKELDAVFQRALQKKPERRYSSVLAFAHAFQRAVLDGGNIFQTLTISALEARTGTNRVVSVPKRRNVIVPIPPGVTHGQIIRLDGYGRPTTYNHPVGALLVTVTIAPVIVTEATPPTTPTFQHTIPAAKSLAYNEARPNLPPVPMNKRRDKIKPPVYVLMIAIPFVLVFLSGLMGFYFVTDHSETTPGKSTSLTPVIIPYPSYLPGKGVEALYDPMKDDSKGYSWNPHPTDYPYCYFRGGTLHVWVVADDTTTRRFRPCMPTTSDFTNFAYQINMTFIQGDCGGVVFRSHEPKEYYFYICQDGQYGLVRYVQNVSDPTINVPLKSRYSSHIKTGLGQTNLLVVVAKGSNIDLYVNQYHIDGVQDSTYSNGTIGVLAKINTASRSEVAFSDAVVWKL